MGDQTTGDELHETVQAEPTDEGIPPAVLAGLPEKYRSFSLASDSRGALVDGSNTYTVTLVDEQAEELYLVEMRDITWHQVNQALSQNLRADASGEGTLDFGGYYRDVAQAKIVSVTPPVEDGQLVQWLTGLNERMGKQLENHLPDPVDELSEAEEKN